MLTTVRSSRSAIRPFRAEPAAPKRQKRHVPLGSLRRRGVEYENAISVLEGSVEQGELRVEGLEKRIASMRPALHDLEGKLSERQDRNGGTILLEVNGDLLDVCKVPKSERSIMIKVQPLYWPCQCVTTVQFLRGIYLQTHGVDISVPDMQTKLRSDLRVYTSSKGFRIKGDTNHANGISITIMHSE